MAAPKTPAITPYEQQRLERIARNKKVLKEMGLVEGWNGLKAKSGGNKNAQKKKRPAHMPVDARPPVRTSARLQGVRAEPWREAEDDRQQEERRVQAVVRASRPEDKVALLDLNLHRLHTMSDEAMSRRISKIRRIDKMESLIEVLKAGNKEELVLQAEQALAQLR